MKLKKKASKTFHKISKLPTWVKCLLVLFVLFALVFHPQFYFGNGFEGKVVDVHGKPIEGAVVVMTFILRQGKFLHGTKKVPLAGEEAVTGSDGTFRLPFWVSNRRPFGAGVGSATPVIRIYKNGYYRSSFYGSEKRNPLSGITMFIPFQPKSEVYVLEKYQSLEEQKKDWVSRYGSPKKWDYPPSYFVCGWKKFPHFINERTEVINSLKQIVPESEYRYLGDPVRQITKDEKAGCSPDKSRMKKTKTFVIKGLDLSDE